MRCSISLLESPRQYAPATFISLKAFSLPVLGTCGPRHRSMNSPCRYSESSSLAGMLSMICALYSSPLSRKNFTASSRAITERETGSAAAAIFFISASIRGEIFRS